MTPDRNNKIEAIYALSPMQQGLVFHSLGGGETAVYLVQSRFGIDGNLDVAALKYAWQRVVDRHSILRTLFVLHRGDEPLQAVLQHAELPWRCEDLRNLPASGREEQLQRFLSEDRAAGMDIKRAPLARLALFRLEDRRHELVWTVHHAILDGWSVPLLLNEVFRFYEARVRAEALTLPPARPFADYIRWLKAQDIAQAEAFWRRTLDGIESPTSLVWDKTKSGATTDVDNVGALETTLTGTVAVALTELARRGRVTVSAIVHAAWAFVLSRHAGECDVVFGSTTSGRPPSLPGIEHMVGLFINTLPVRVRVDDELSVLEWIRRLHEDQVELRQFEYTSLADVQRWSGVPRGTPLFETLLVFENYPVLTSGADGESGSSTIRVRPSPAFEFTNYPITVIACLGGEELSLSFAYDADRLRPESVERMAGHLARVLSDIVRDPEQRVGQLTLLSKDDRARLLTQWSGATALAADTAGRGLHTWFEEQARRTPDAIAVESGARAATYRELNERSNRVAHALMRRGVGPGVLVGIALERGVEMVEGLLGILKAGGGYVPLDPAYPQQRVAWILESARPPVVLAHAHLTERLLSDAAAEVIVVDEGWSSLAMEAVTDPGVSPDPEDLAYVIYTSGSTGRPKGVAIRHGGASALVAWAREFFAAEDLAGMLASTSICFDLSVFELFTPLSAGGRVVVVENALALPTCLGRGRVTLVNTVPSVMSELVRQGGLPASVRAVCLAGEPLSSALVDRIYDVGVGRVYDLYAPSETTTYSTYTLRERGGRATIGRPIPGERFYVVDQRGEPVPEGLPGELWIGGCGLARGYYGAPGQTAERFVPDPHSAGERVYRTGDLARWCDGGDLEYLGRIDHQVKVRGFRIELGEIEAGALQCSGVREAVAVVSETRPGERRVALYVTHDSVGGPDEEALKTHLAARVPSYMVPSFVLVLEALPRTPNGKLDRRALPTPDPGGTAAEYVAPRTDAETTLARIWAEVLPVERVGVTDDFFRAGGDSILSMLIIARAGQAGLSLTPRQVFENPTIAQLAALATHEAPRRGDQGAVVGRVEPLPIHRQLFAQGLAEPWHYNQSVIFGLREAVPADRMRAALDALVCHHDALRLRCVVDGNDCREEIAPEEGARFEVVELRGRDPTERRSAIAEHAAESQRGFDFRGGALFRAVLFLTDERGADRLLMVAHHVVIDTMSWRILAEDLESALGQLTAGEELRLPAKTCSVLEWGNRLSELARGDELMTEVDYWCGQAWDAVAPLPIDHDNGPNEIGTLDAVSFELDVDETRAVLRELPEVFRTQIDDVLLTALVEALAPWTGQRAASLEFEGHGREDLFDDVDLSRSVGWFTSVYPLVLDLRGADGLVASLRRVLDQRRAIPRRGVGFGILRELRADGGGLGSLPRAEIAFNYLGQFHGSKDSASILSAADESMGDSVSRRNATDYLLEITGGVRGGCLRIQLAYSRNRFHRETIDAVAERFAVSLRELITASRAPSAIDYAAADFPLAGLDDDSLERLVDGLQRSLGADGPRLEIESIYPMPPAQRGIVYHSTSAREDDVYFTQTSMRIHGELDAVLFREAWSAVVRRHAALRTAFVSHLAERDLQVVRRNVDAPWHEEDLRALTVEQQDARIHEWATRDRRGGFDLRRAPLMRLALFRRADDQHDLLWSLHHAVHDGWSRPIVVDEVFAIYEAARRGEDPGLPEPRSYESYMEWLARQDHPAVETYWRQKLAGLERSTAFPWDRPADTAASPATAAFWATLPGEMSDAIERLGKENGLTVSTILHGAWALLLSLYSGEDDVVFGSTVSGRPPEVEGVERIVGLFINSLPIRVRVDREVAAVEWLQCFQRDLLELRQFEHSSIVDVQGWSEVPRRTPLFETLVVFENYPIITAGDSAERSLRCEMLGSEESTNYPLTVIGVKPERELVVGFLYHGSRLSKETVRRTSQHLLHLLSGLGARPHAPLGDLVLLDESERRTVLEVFSGAATPGADTGGRGLHTWFEEQAAGTPDAIALEAGSRSVTYRELNERANRVAHGLRRRGVGPGVLVGIALDRGAEMVEGLLGVLKAGAGYVPLDPGYPAQRAEWILESARPTVVLAHAQLIETLLAGATAEVIEVDETWAACAEEATTNPAVPVDPEGLAYVIYTSGSTGRPKGVAIRHGGASALVAWAREFFPAEDLAAVLAGTSICFDLSVFELFLPLSAGGCIVLAENPLALAECTARERVSLVNTVPSVMSELVGRGELPASVRVVCLAGEPLSAALVNQIYDAGVDRVYDLYAPSETTTYSTWTLRQRDGLVTIGVPIPGERMYVVDRDGAPVQQGVPGELWIGGAGLARGYYGAPDQTAERFVPDPYRDGERVYRTGDLARWGEDGQLEYLGRIDHQVKIRGFRIELGEIEAVLEGHSAVNRAVVTVDQSSADPRLVAHVVMDRQHENASVRGAASDDQTSSWRGVWDEAYDRQRDNVDSAFDIRGWNSSYTAEPIPAEEMREWRDHTVQRIAALNPRRVLEIGCGTGLLLLELAPRCERYWGTDFSQAALQRVGSQVEKFGLRGVELLKRGADDFSELEPGAFDTVVLNSVAQYLPDVEYLLRVLDGAVRLVADGGRVFVGDVRSLPLLEAFCASVQLHQALGALTRAQLRARVDEQMANEGELLIDPEFFDALADRLPAIRHVEVQLKRGGYHNELTRVRYDVILHVGGEVAACEPAEWLEGPSAPSLAELRRRLITDAPEVLGLRGVANSRLAVEGETLAWLEGDGGPDTVGELRDAQSSWPGIDPEDLWRLGEELSYRVAVRWSADGVPNHCDAVFYRPTADRADEVVAGFARPRLARQPWRAYVNDALRSEIERKLVLQLRAFTREKLPDYMVPAAFAVREELPLTPNGKVDRRALVASESARVAAAERYEPPSTPTEQLMAGIWQELLGVDRVGRHDNFFDLGGHSLLAMRVVFRLEQEMGERFSPMDLHEPDLEQFARMCEGRSGAGRSERSLKPVPRDGALPPSPGQERFWFLSQIEVDKAAYNVPFALHLAGALDIAALEWSLAEIVRRHETLRTTFTHATGKLSLCIAPPGETELPIHDFSAAPDPRGEVRTEVQREAQKAFDLERGPVCRFVLWKLSDDEHVLLTVMHHVTIDEWSQGVYLAELAQLYEARAGGLPSLLEDLEIQYADYAYWQRRWYEEEADDQLAYWKTQLADLPTLELPADRPRPAAQTFGGRVIPWTIPAPVATGLKALAKAERCTFFMAALAAFKVLLARYSGQDDIVVGTPIANRTGAATEPLIGLFLNTLVLRTDLSGQPAFREVLRRVREMSLEAFVHRDLPFEQLVNELPVDRDPSRNPLFQVLFQTNEMPTALSFGDVRVESFRHQGVSAKFDLTFGVIETDDGMVGGFEYNVDLFDQATVERMGEHLVRLLEEIVAHPDLCIWELPIRTEAERRTVLEVFSGAATPGSNTGGRGLHTWFEEQAAATPDATALEVGARSVTYRELSERSNRVAHALLRRGVGPGVLVGIALDRGVEMVEGLLGILKAGGGYVPLDPAYPEQRVAWIVESACPKVVLAHAHLIERLLSGVAAEVIVVDEGWSSLATEAVTDPGVSSDPEDLAYVIYTSGSTGRPKGVAIRHGSASALVAWAREFFAAEDLAGMLASTSICFDLSVFELFTPLSVGGSVVLVENALALPACSGRERVTLVNSVPSVMSELLRQGGLPASVRVVCLAGEPLSSALVDRIYEAGVDRVYDLYAPSETTTYSTYTLRERGGRATIGRPIPGERIYVADRRGEPVPEGLPGELWIGGCGLARGYYGAPDQTAERFVPDPYRDGERVYRTGDLVRWVDDGQLEYLGRMDHQVKIRGFRIELGEIETVLEAHPSVSRAVVTVDETPADQRLVAHVVMDRQHENASIRGAASDDTTSTRRGVWDEAYDGKRDNVDSAVDIRDWNSSDAAKPIPADELRAFAREKLPDYMVPAAFAVRDELPLMPNGKVDRRALVASGSARVAGAERYEPPSSPTERLMAGIWEELLDVDQVGLHDNFFDLGGHSLLAMRVVFRLEQEMGERFSPMDLLEPDLEQFARMCEDRRGVAPRPSRALEPAPRDEPLPLSPGQERFWFLSQLEVDKSAYNVPLALDLAGELDIAALRWSLAEIVRRHETLRTTFTHASGSLSLRIAPPGQTELPIIDLSAASDPRGEARTQVQREAQRAFDLDRGPVCRFVLWKLSGDEHVLLAVMHHVTTDEWSQGIFLVELGRLYEARTRGLPSPLEDLEIQYPDYAYWQRQWYEQEAEEQLAYWKTQLADLPTLELSTDRPRPAVQTFGGRLIPWTIPTPVAAGLKALAKSERCTFFMATLAAFKVLLARYSGQDDIVVGTPIANRGAAATEPLIGLFLNTLVLRSDLSGQPGFREVLRRVRAVSLGAFAHRDLPFGQLVNELPVERDLSRNPLFQVLFQTNEMPTGVSLGDVRVETFGHPGVSAKFDLTLSVIETDDGMVGSFEFNVDLFDQGTVERMGQHLGRLLEAIVVQPDVSVWELPILTDTEQELFREVNQTARSPDDLRCFHESFEERAECAPAAIAVQCGDEALTYGALNARVNQLARHLRSLGAGPQKLVGISIDRSVDMLVALLGILKSGAGYVPLDPAYPVDRLAVILEDSGVELLVTTENLRGDLPGDLPATVYLDADAELIAVHSAENPLPLADLQDLAYVIFTSGSTGRPKGVQIEHQALANFLLSMATEPGISADDVLVAVTTISFDIAGLELYLPLLVGGTVVIATPDVVADGEKLAAMLEGSGGTVMQATPATWQLLVQSGWRGSPGLVMLCGGEALPRWLADELLDRGRRLWNLYGPTETTIWSSALPVERGDGAVPIGRPIDNTRLYVLDDHLQRTPFGVLGELYIGGGGLARGYHGRPDLTAERFVPNLVEGETRLYATGDVVSYRPDGTLDFQGRSDYQVKLRGYRIELGEIEATLLGHPALSECVVCTYEPRPSDKRLAAYVVGRDGVPASDELRSFVRATLPEYMTPGVFVALDTLPRTPNGKVDRRSLPPPESSLLGSSIVSLPPTTPMEVALAEIWSDVLGTEAVGVHDHFLDVGGNSLLAMEVVIKTLERTGCRPELRSLFLETLGQLAAGLEPAAAETERPKQGLVDRARSLLRRASRRGRPSELETNWGRDIDA